VSVSNSTLMIHTSDDATQHAALGHVIG